MPTTVRHVSYVAARLAGANQTQAAIAAGYSAKTAAQMGCKLEKHPWIIDELAKGRSGLAKKFTIVGDTVLDELAAIAGANVADFLLPSGLINTDLTDRAKWRCVKKIKVTSSDGKVLTTELELHDKLMALGLFKPASPFDEPEEPVAENIPARVASRKVLLAVQIALREMAAQPAAPAAPPIKH
jgi:hypothetical protein